MDRTWLDRFAGNATARAQHEVERFRAEMAFADSLCELEPDNARSWRPLIRKADETVRAALDSGGLTNVGDVVRVAEMILAPVAQAAKQYTVHCVGHAHIDMNWMWSWPETVAVTNDTFATVLRLMDEYKGFCFSQSQASTYAIMEKYNPDMLKRIARRVKQGRWEVTASHWVEGDKNLASAESLCRHLLYTRQYMQKLFGLKPEDVPIDWSPDTFGHAATVPTYLVRGGIRYLYLHRPGVHSPSKPEAFWWQGPDGSRVLVRNDMVLAYNGQVTPAVGQFLVRFVRETGCKDYMFVFGVGDHGGGPTRRDILWALELDTWPVFPNVRFSTVCRFFELLEKQSAKLPVICGEFNTEFTGCYTTQTLIKKDNRFAENRLVDAEVACAVASAVGGRRYPTEALRECWRDTLFSHFHDILPGSGVHDTRTYTNGLYQRTVAATGAAETQALRHIASLIDTSGAGDASLPDAPPAQVTSSIGAGVGTNSVNGNLTFSDQSAGHGPRPFVLFNPTAQDREEVVEATVWSSAPWGSPPFRSRSFSVRLPDGKTLPAQVVGGGGYWGHDSATVAFPARVEGFGYSCCAVVENSGASAPERDKAGTVWQVGMRHHCPYAHIERSREGLENDLILVELDTASGGIRSLVDKRSGVELIAPASAAPALEYALERPHGMTAWSIEHTGPVEQPTVVAMRRALQGPYKATIEVDLRLHESDLTLTYELRAEDPKLYVHLRGTWFQRGTPQTGVPVLRMALPLALAKAQAKYEIPFGAIERDLSRGEEVPALQWAQVSGLAGKKRAGCVLANDSKYGHSLDGSTLRLTLIRSAYDPDILPEIGQHEVHVALAPFSGALPTADAIRLGNELNHAIRVVSTDVHEGKLAPSAHFLSVGPDSVVVCGLKRAENGRGLIVRVFETAGAETEARIGVNTDLLGKVEHAVEVDLLERPLAQSAAKKEGGGVSVRVPPFGIASVLIALRK